MPHQRCYPLTIADAIEDTFRVLLPTSAMSRCTACWRHFPGAAIIHGGPRYTNNSPSREGGSGRIPDEAIRRRRAINAIREAVDRSECVLRQEAKMRSLRNRYASLTAREREVLDLVVTGELNKQVGGELGISEITVKAHRGKMMRKMQAGSLVDLVNMAAILRPASVPNP